METPSDPASLACVVESQTSLVPIQQTEIVSAIAKIGKKPPTPTRAYIDFWVECRARIEMGPESTFGHHVRCFVNLHSQAMRNFGWGCAGILEFYLDENAVSRGCPVRMFDYGIAEYLQKAKIRWKPQETKSAPAGIQPEADEVMSDEERKSMFAKLLDKLRAKKS